jgi:hypothetical protein
MQQARSGDKQRGESRWGGIWFAATSGRRRHRSRRGRGPGGIAAENGAICKISGGVCKYLDRDY